MTSAAARTRHGSTRPERAAVDEQRNQSTNTPRAVQWSVFVAAAAIVVYLCLLILRPFLNVIGWSAVLAITCYPLHQRLVRHTRRPGLSAFITSTLMVLSVGVPLLLTATIAMNQLVAIREPVRQMFLDPRRTAAAVASVAQRLGLDPNAAGSWASERISDVAAHAGQYTMSAAAGLGGAIASFALVAFATFLLLRDSETLVGKIPDLLPFDRSRSEALLRRIREVVYGSMYGVVTIAMIQGALNGGMFWLLGVPAAALWGLVTVFASMLPLVGTAAVWVPGTLYLLMIGAWQKAIVLAVWGAAVVSSVDNILRPRLVAGRVGLSGVALFVAMLGGLEAFGALGIVLGPVAFAAAAALVEVLREAQTRWPQEVHGQERVS